MKYFLKRILGFRFSRDGKRLIKAPKYLRSANIPPSVTEIGRDAFSQCTKLKSISLPPSVEKIANGAFSCCFSLESILIPQSVKSIGNYAFYMCGDLESITIPQSVEEIGTNVFQFCHSLKTIVVDNRNQFYDSRENCNAIIETKSNCLICGCKTSTIPSSVTRIGKNTFYFSNIWFIDIPSSVKEIGDYAFCWCVFLESITISTSVKEIGKGAFSLSGLKSINFSSPVIHIGERAFAYCQLSSITGLTSQSRIEQDAFLIYN